MPRKKPPIQPVRVQRAGQADSGEPSQWLLAPFACLGLAILLELVLYYGDAPLLHLQQRRESLNFLAAPDQLFLLWCGEKLAYFSLADRWPIVAWTAAILATAWLAGRLMLHALGLMWLLDRLERQVFAIGG